MDGRIQRFIQVVGARPHATNAKPEKKGMGAWER